MSLLQRPLKRTDTDHDCSTHDTCLCHTRHARLYNMFPLQAGSSKRGWMGGGLCPLLTSRGNVLTGTSVIFGCYRVDIRVIHAWRGCLRVHPNKESAAVTRLRSFVSSAKVQLKNQDFVFEKHICGVVSCVKGGINVWVKIGSTWSRFLKFAFHIHMFSSWLTFSCPAITFPSTHYSQIFLQTLTDKSNQEAAESKLLTHLWFVWFE